LFFLWGLKLVLRSLQRGEGTPVLPDLEILFCVFPTCPLSACLLPVYPSLLFLGLLLLLLMRRLPPRYKLMLQLPHLNSIFLSSFAAG